MKRIGLITATTAIILAGASCGKAYYVENADNPDTVVEENPNNDPFKKIELDTRSETFIEQGKTFAFDFIRRVNEVDEKSFIISPLSMQLLLGMILDGAQGGTADEICQVLGYEAGSIQAANAFASTMLEQLPAVDKTTTLSIGNAIFVNQSFTILDGFRSSVVQYYDAEVSNLDFADSESATGRINQWCADRTNGLIDHVLDQVDPAILAFLMNAVYFKGQWKNKFPAETTAQERFVDENGHESAVPMMKNDASFLYQENDVFRAVRLPYGDGAYQMTVILPQTGKTLKDAVSVLDARQWNDLNKSLSGCQVDVWLPKFETKSHLNLNQLLIEMGMPSAFDEMRADFSAMSSVSPLFFSLIMQDAVIKVDEEGTEAAAVSTGTAATSVPEHHTFHADHPFLYLITESSTGAILFAGKFTK